MNWACGRWRDSSARCAKACCEFRQRRRTAGRGADAGSVQRNLFRACLSGAPAGLPLVEGQDLTVRADTVYLKTLAGLRRVHAILRRLDDDYCDPVELRSDSALGVPGLHRRGARPACGDRQRLGSGRARIRRVAGISAAAPRSGCSGETLRLPALATWWCGERPALDYVLDESRSARHQADLSRTSSFEPVFGRDLEARSARRSSAFAGRPYAYVAQERWHFAGARVAPAAPVGFAARALTIRVYAIATPRATGSCPAGWRASPPRGAVDIVSTQRGGGSKDIWVSADPARESVDEAGVGEVPLLPRRMRPRRTALAAGRRICSGWAVTRCAARTRRGCCAPRWRRGPMRRCGAAARAIIRYGVLPPEGDPAVAVFDDAHEFGLCGRPRAPRLVRHAGRAAGFRPSTGALSASCSASFSEAGAARHDPRETLDRLLLSLAALAASRWMT